MNLQNMTQISPFTYRNWNPDQTISKLPEIQCLVLQYYDNREYKIIGRCLISRHPNALRPKWTSKTWRKSNHLRTWIETRTKRSLNDLKFNSYYSNTMTTTNIIFLGRSLMSRYPNPLRSKWTSKTWRKSNLLRTGIETPTKPSRNCLKFNVWYYNTMTTGNINLYVVVLCLGTQTLCGRNEHPKHDKKSNNLRTWIETRTKRSPNDLKFNSYYSNTITTPNINL